MMGDSKIEWTEKTWNPFTGCTKVSPGCKHCYAERIWPRVYGGTGRAFSDIKFHEDRLRHPYGWKKPARVFVNSMSDFFHEAITNENRNRAWEVMFDCERHTFQILTKRPEVSLEFQSYRKHRGRNVGYPNIHVGVSVEDQSQVGRLETLREFETIVPWVSLEPLIGPVDIAPYLDFLKWVVVGGESGPGARPMHPDWPRSVRDQCAKAGVPFFFKQHGEWAEFTDYGGLLPNTVFMGLDGTVRPGEWEQETDAMAGRVGKKAAGRLLDGELHDARPALAHEGSG